MSIENAVALKKLGNVALISGIFSEALKYYNEALDLLNQNDLIEFQRITIAASLYSKRSIALLRMGKYYYAFKDAKQIVALAPEWFKGSMDHARFSDQ